MQPNIISELKPDYIYLAKCLTCFQKSLLYKIKCGQLVVEERYDGMFEGIKRWFG